MVHRDVKPSNILLCREPPCVKIFDFGIAKLQDEIDVDRVAPTLTGTGEIVGTERDARELEAAPTSPGHRLAGG